MDNTRVIRLWEMENALLELSSLVAALSQAEKRADKYQSALESLTEGGTYYHNSLSNCVANIRERLSTSAKHKLLHYDLSELTTQWELAAKHLGCDPNQLVAAAKDATDIISQTHAAQEEINRLKGQLERERDHIGRLMQDNNHLKALVKQLDTEINEACFRLGCHPHTLVTIAEYEVTHKAELNAQIERQRDIITDIHQQLREQKEAARTANHRQEALAEVHTRHRQLVRAAHEEGRTLDRIETNNLYAELHTAVKALLE